MKRLRGPKGRDGSDTFVCEENACFPVWPDAGEGSGLVTESSLKKKEGPRLSTLSVGIEKNQPTSGPLGFVCLTPSQRPTPGKLAGEGRAGSPWGRETSSAPGLRVASQARDFHWGLVAGEELQGTSRGTAGRRDSETLAAGPG